MRYIFYILFLCVSANAQDAFPGAKGGGKSTTGGRGGTVIVVSNLNDSGAGSLREALTTSGARTIVFDVSGRINLTSILEVPDEAGSVTIAGQTAPQGGITISGKPISFGGGFSIGSQECDNVIVRFIRFRNNTVSGLSDQYLENGLIGKGNDGLYIDHCSFSFNADQNLSLSEQYGNFQNVSISRNIFGLCGTGTILGVDDSAFTSNNISYFLNAHTHVDHRTPNMGLDARYDVLNNIVFNWETFGTNINRAGPEVNYWGNYMIRGTSYNGDGFERENFIQMSTTSVPLLYSGFNYHAQLYPTPQDDDWGLWEKGGPVPATSEYFVTNPYTLIDTSYEVLTAADAYTTILADSGANAYVDDSGVRGFYLDSYDTQCLNDIATLTSRTTDMSGPETQPTLPTNTRPAGWDDDVLGIPDSFSTAHGITTWGQIIAEYTFGSEKYENIHNYPAGEIYLAYAAGDLEPFLIPIGGGIKITPATKVGVGAGIGKVIIGQ